MALTEKEIARSIQQGPGMSFNQTCHSAGPIFKILKNTLPSGDVVLTRGFGKSRINEKAARKDRNLQTREPLTLKQRKIVMLQFSGTLRERLDKSIA